MAEGLSRTWCVEMSCTQIISLFVGEIYPVSDMHLEDVDADEYQNTLDKHHKVLRTIFLGGLVV
jgi:uncharacterized membrane protein